MDAFLRNLLLDEKNELHNRSMHISGMFEKADIGSTKADIESAEADIENQKADIRNRLLSFSDMIAEKTIEHALELFLKCGKKRVFWQNDSRRYYRIKINKSIWADKIIGW